MGDSVDEGLVNAERHRVLVVVEELHARQGVTARRNDCRQDWALVEEDVRERIFARKRVPALGNDRADHAGLAGGWRAAVAAARAHLSAPRIAAAGCGIAALATRAREPSHALVLRLARTPQSPRRTLVRIHRARTTGTDHA